MAHSKAIGKTFGKWTVLAKSHVEKTNTFYLCQCNCGFQEIKRLDNIKKSRPGPCNKPHKPNQNRKGLTNHPLAKHWANMNYRCNPRYQKTTEKYKTYCNTKVCPEWQFDNPNGLQNFIDDMYSSYFPGAELDKDKLGDGTLYSKNTCCWLTPSENKKVKKNYKATPEIINKIIQLRNNNNYTYKEIAEVVNMSRTQVSKLYKENKEVV